MTGLALTSSTIPVWANVRNPGNDASSRYGPIGRFDRTYEPVSLVTAVRVAAVAVCVAVISTPGKTAPVRSLAVPLICAVACAPTLLEVQAQTEHATISA